MSAVIVNDYYGDKGIELPNASIGRTVNLPSDWRTLIVSILYNLTTGSSINITGTPRFYIGLSSGSGTQLIGDSNIGHWYGIISNGATWTYGSASNNVYYTNNVISEYIYRNNTASIGTDLESATAYFVTNQNTASVSLFTLVYTKDRPTSPATYSMKYLRAVNRSVVGQNYSSFLQSLQSSVYAPTNYSYIGAATEVLDETTDGSFDTVNIAWNREASDPTLILYAVGVSLVS